MEKIGARMNWQTLFQSLSHLGSVARRGTKGGFEEGVDYYVIQLCSIPEMFLKGFV